MDAQFNVAFKKARQRLGKVETIILEETEGDTVLGRTKMEAPEIDAVVRLPQKAARQGPFVQAKLTSYDSYEFTAEGVLPAWWTGSGNVKVVRLAAVVTFSGSAAAANAWFKLQNVILTPDPFYSVPPTREKL